MSADSLTNLVKSIETDEACWRTVEEEFTRLRAITAERRRLERLLDTQKLAEEGALQKLHIALRVVKNRQEGGSNG